MTIFMGGKKEMALLVVAYPELSKSDYDRNVGIGNSLDPLACLAMAREWNKDEFAISGWVLKLDIISYEDDTTKTIQRITLENP